MKPLLEWLTHALERTFPAFAFLHSTLRRFSKSLPIFDNFPGWLDLSSKIREYKRPYDMIYA